MTHKELARLEDLLRRFDDALKMQGAPRAIQSKVSDMYVAIGWMGTHGKAVR